MLQYILWGISFFTLWITIVWINYVYSDTKENGIKRFPSVTIAIPAFNEEKTLERGLSSIVKSNYPKDKLNIIIVNDGSTDNTKKAALKLIKKYKNFNIRLINKRNGGKASAVNSALEKTKTELFGVVDADSRIEKDSLRVLIPSLENPKTGAAISRIKVDSPKNIVERVQRFEYIMSTLLRKIMAALGTLSMTPGVLSVYKTDVIKKLGGFTKEKDNLTEDLEIALRLRYNGYNVEMNHKSITHTFVPPNLKKLWQQRIRWSRGYIHNHWKYKDMFFSRKHGVLGVFQLPVNVLAILFLVVNIGIISVILISDLSEFLIRSITIKGYFIDHFTSLPSIKEIVLRQNMHILIPLFVVSILGFYLVYKAHKQFKEKIFRHIASIFTYFIAVPYFTTVNWIVSLVKELFKTKRSW